MNRLTWRSTIAVAAIACSLAAQDRRVTPVGASARRVALVIGNNTYATSPLANAARDAQAIKAALEASGFNVRIELNTPQQRLEEAVEQFAAAIRPGDVALFYYSGHGIQIQDQNYLVPVDFQAATAVAAKYKSYPVSRVVESLEAAGAALQIVILDACRDNPYRSIRSGTGGLAPMQVGTGTYLAFATAPGRTASDNPSGQNGLFTQELASVLRQPGLSLDDVFNQVRARVSQKSRSQQVPWSTSSVVGNFYFERAPIAVAASLDPLSRPPGGLADEAAWNLVKDSNRRDLLEQFLKEYPSSSYAGAARLKIATLAPVPKCSIDGMWGENQQNDFRWRFQLQGNTLTINRTDNFVSGTFTQSGNQWIGQLHWGNGDAWNNVVFTPNSNCNEVRTNQSWWYKR